MTDLDRGFVATAAIKPLYFLEWERDFYFVYIMGFRTGTLIAGSESAMYRSAAGGYRLFPSVHEAVATLERLADWVAVADAEMTNKQGVYA